MIQAGNWLRLRVLIEKSLALHDVLPPVRLLQEASLYNGAELGKRVVHSMPAYLAETVTRSCFWLSSLYHRAVDPLRFLLYFVPPTH